METSALHVLLARVVGAAPGPVVIIDLAGRFVYANTSAHDFYELPEGAMVGLFVWEADTSFSPEQWQEWVAAIDAKGGQSLARDVCDASGSIRSLDTFVTFIEEGADRYVVGYTRDVTHYRRMEQHLREFNITLERALSEASRLAMVVNRTTGLVMITDPQGRIEWVNSGFSEVTEYTIDEVIGLRSNDFLWRAEDNPNLNKLLRQQLERGQGVRIEVLNYTKSGRPFWVDLEAQPFADDEGRHAGYTVFATDISERKRMQQELEANQQRMQAFLNAIPDVMLHVSREGTILDFNSPQNQEHPLLDAKSKGQRLHDIFSPLFTNFALERIRAAIEGGGVRTLEYSVPTAGGGHADYDARIVASGANEVMWVATNVTERKRIVRAMLESESRLAEAQRIAHIGNWEIDIHSGVMDWSDEAYRIFGFTPGSLIPNFKQFDLLLQSDDVARFRQEFAVACAKGSDFSDAPRLRLRDGRARTVHMLGRPVLDEKGHVSRYFGTVQDITDQRAAEQAKNEFVSTVSHELRTPLTAIRGSLGLLLGNALGELPEPVRQLVDMAQRNADRLLQLVNDLLDVGRMDAGSMELHLAEHQLQPLLLNVINATQPYGDKYGIQYRILQAVDGVRVNVDTHRFNQIMANLLSNAAKFSGRDQATLKTEFVDVIMEQLSEGVRISVRDYGVGIPREHHHRLFQRFSQVDASNSRAQGGTGLGLSIAKSLVERMGGRMGFDSEPGKGSTFWFTLPVMG